MKEAVSRGIERCILLAVFHNCEEAIIVNSAFTQVGFAEFMMDLAGFDAMPKALQAKVEQAAEESGGATAVGTIPALLPSPAAGQTNKLISALTGLGFGAPSVKKWVKSIGVRAESENLPILVKDGVRALVSANPN